LPIDSVVTDIPGGGAETPDFNTVPITCLRGQSQTMADNGDD